MSPLDLLAWLSHCRKEARVVVISSLLIRLAHAHGRHGAGSGPKVRLLDAQIYPPIRSCLASPDLTSSLFLASLAVVLVRSLCRRSACVRVLTGLFLAGAGPSAVHNFSHDPSQRGMRIDRQLCDREHSRYVFFLQSADTATLSFEGGCFADASFAEPSANVLLTTFPFLAL
jgi:hypothetical protein